MARLSEALRGLPKKLKIGFGEWEIKLVKKNALDGAFGQCDKNDLEITLERGWRYGQTVNTAIHEPLHAIWHAANLPERAAEEQVVTAMAHGLQQMLRDNPKYARWWSRHVCRVET